MEYSKPWLIFERQADLLINERGLIADRDCLIAHLADIGYYRLSGYWYNFKRKPVSDEDGEKDERFVEGTTFEQVWKLYVFDRQFRLVVLDAIERIEVFFARNSRMNLPGQQGRLAFWIPRTFPV